jgi:ribonuclease D
MPKNKKQGESSILEFSGDIPRAIAQRIRDDGILAWDIETTGLDWRGARIATAQVWSPSVGVVLVHVSELVPSGMVQLLQDVSISKIFHHAMFDLRFMRHHWGAVPRNVSCTKIAAKLLFPPLPDGSNAKEHSLVNLLSKMLSVRISKSAQTSNWMAANLSPEQLIYAANDVQYLVPLLDRLREGLETQELWSLAEICFTHLPTRVELEVRGYPDLFTY